MGRNDHFDLEARNSPSAASEGDPPATGNEASEPGDAFFKPPVIERGVPIPERRTRPRKKAQHRRYPHGTVKRTLVCMKATDSVFIQCQPSEYNWIDTIWRKTAKELSIKITMRKVDGGYRLWRLK